jgi:transposase
MVSSVGFGQKPRRQAMAAGSTKAVLAELKAAKRRFKLAADCEVASCYEAGRDGFWLHRFLESEGVRNHVVDSSSIEVNRKRRRAKSDSLDGDSLQRLLMRYSLNGETKVWSVVRVPTDEEEDRRHMHRGLSMLKKEATRESNRIRGLLATQGIRLKGAVDLSKGQLESMTLWNGAGLRQGLKERLKREWERLAGLKKEIAAQTKVQTRALREETASEPDVEKMRQLEKLRAIGPVGAWLLVREMYGWRKFRNRRQVGAVAGLTPTPYQSGDRSTEQGISKSGIKQVREIAIELAWGWLRYQPNSKLSVWYRERFANGGARARKVGIVALARRLLIELWRYLETGAIPEGAELKAA